MIRQGMNSIATTLLNVQAAVYGDAAIAAFSIVNRVSGLLFSAALGLGQGLQPVCAFNYGAKKYRRVRHAFLFTFSLATGLLTAVCILCLFNAEQIVMLFRKDTDVVRIGSEALRYTCIGLIALPASALSSMLFQSAGKKGRAIFIAMLQSGAIFIPLLLILPGTCPSCSECSCRIDIPPFFLCLPPRTEKRGRIIYRQLKNISCLFSVYNFIKKHQAFKSEVTRSQFKEVKGLLSLHFLL